MCHLLGMHSGGNAKVIHPQVRALCRSSAMLQEGSVTHLLLKAAARYPGAHEANPHSHAANAKD